MKTLLEERFAPITTQIGYLELPLQEATVVFEQWQRSLYGRVDVSDLREGFPESLRSLEPLVGGARPRKLLVGVGNWTAYFDNSLRGTDPESPIGHISRTAPCSGVQILTAPHTIGLHGNEGRAGGLLFRLFGPLEGEFLNYVRTVSVIWDGTRWVFDAVGTPQAFEETERYTARRVRERFTSDMLERYCQALGLDVFNHTVYGPKAVLFHTDVQLPENPVVMSLEEAQEALEIRPGEAESLPG